MKLTIPLAAFIIAVFCSKIRAQDVTQYVQPLSGTAAATTPASLKHSESLVALYANTIPATGVPLAMTQWTPQTQATEKKCIPPYYYKDSMFSGFRASHWLSGSCTQDYGSVTIMPLMGSLKKTNYATAFSHQNEQATPYQYTIDFPAEGLQAAVSGTRRCGIMRFTAQKADSFYLLITPNSEYNEGAVLVQANERKVTGYNPAHRIYQGWGKPAGFSGYFALEVNAPPVVSGCFATNGMMTKDSLKNQAGTTAYLGFYLKKGETLLVKTGTSFTSIQNADANLKAELPGWNFEAVSTAAKEAWKQELSKIQVTTASEKDKRIFYTAFYHALQHPRLFSDVNGDYPKFASQYRNANIGTGAYYDDFSMWDIYRAQLPLLELLSPQLTGNLVQSLLTKAQQGGWMPIFPCWNSYTSEMIGDHAASVIASAFLKGIRGFDEQAAYAALRKNAFDLPAKKEEYIEGKGRRALDSYLKYGFIPLEDSVPDAFHKKEQVSRVLEYAYDDYAVAAMAQKMGKIDDYKSLSKRAGYYENVFDTAAGMVRGRYANGTWVQPFSPDKKQSYITEGTPRQYTFYVPQDVPGLAKLMNGRKVLEQSLDSLFIKGEYWHGNEPGHQSPFMYNFTAAPWKTQRQVRKIVSEEYSDGPGGLSGNDDAGQMSAWYMLAALGFYPLDPVSGQYLLCSPIFDKSVLNLPEGKKLEISTTKPSSDAMYIGAVKWNGKPYRFNYICYADMIKGGKLQITLQEQPAGWGGNSSQQPGNYPALR